MMKFLYCMNRRKKQQTVSNNNNECNNDNDKNNIINANVVNITNLKHHIEVCEHKIKILEQQLIEKKHQCDAKSFLINKKEHQIRILKNKLSEKEQII